MRTTLFQKKFVAPAFQAYFRSGLSEIELGLPQGATDADVQDEAARLVALRKAFISARDQGSAQKIEDVNDALINRAELKRYRGDRFPKKGSHSGDETALSVPSFNTVAAYGKTFSELGVAWSSPACALFASYYTSDAIIECVSTGEVAAFACAPLLRLKISSFFVSLSELMRNQFEPPDEKSINTRKFKIAAKLLRRSEDDKRELVLRREVLSNLKSLHPKIFDRVAVDLEVFSRLSDTVQSAESALSSSLSVQSATTNTYKKNLLFTAERAKRSSDLERFRTEALSYREAAEIWFLPVLKNLEHSTRSQLNEFYEKSLTLLDLFACAEKIGAYR